MNTSTTSSHQDRRSGITKVYLYSEQPLLARGWATVLAEAGGFQLQCFSSGLGDLIVHLETGLPDVLLLDLEPKDTPQALGLIRQEAPSLKLVLWVNAISTELALQVMSLGVRGILRQNLPVELQIQCLRDVHQGGLWYEKALTDSFLAAKQICLSRREGQLMVLVAHGLKNKEIASALGLTEGTVKVYLSKLFQKTGAKDRFELALCGLKNLPPEPFEETGAVGGPQAVPGLRMLMLERHTRPVVSPAV